MSYPTVLFILIFVVPLIGLLIWLMNKDKRKGKVGLAVLGIIVIIALTLMYVMTKGK